MQIDIPTTNALTGYPYMVISNNSFFPDHGQRAFTIRS